MTINWNKYFDTVSCPWENEIDSRYQFLKNNFDDLVSKTNWRKICMNDGNSWHGFLYYRDHNPRGKLIIIPKLTTIYITIGILILIVLLFILFLLIAYCRYKVVRYDPSTEDSEIVDMNHDDLSKSKSFNNNKQGFNGKSNPQHLYDDREYHNNQEFHLTNEKFVLDQNFYPTDEEFRLDQDFNNSDYKFRIHPEFYPIDD